MKLKSDRYSFRARVLPVYITLAPVVLLLVALIPEGLKLPLGGATAVVFVPISFLLSQIGTDFGKRLEKRLWRDWRGPATTRFLRHGNHDEFDEITRDRVHNKLRTLGLHVPRREEQEQDRLAADKHYESCTEELIRRTRDHQKFPLVFKGLVEYGFRRNLLGLKTFGLLLAFASLAGATWSAYATWSSDGIPAVPMVAGLITTGLLFAWPAWVTEGAVKLAANRYARFILEAALDQG